MAVEIGGLEDLAREMVGDGKRPNLYFVTRGGKVQTVTRDSHTAYHQWHALSVAHKEEEPCLEDRLTGTICSVERSEDDTVRRFVVCDDYHAGGFK